MLVLGADDSGGTGTGAGHVPRVPVVSFAMVSSRAVTAVSEATALVSAVIALCESISVAGAIAGTCAVVVWAVANLYKLITSAVMKGIGGCA